MQEATRQSPRLIAIDVDVPIIILTAHGSTDLAAGHRRGRAPLPIELRAACRRSVD
jgi:hypothetical protein